ncbi:ATP synthase F1 subunit epsilon [Candidatus Liberibacter asiaticus]|uniref:ATP synthase epsilon chain n=2 Tax=Liberibacter asiaticus TaxID=34021 RepID=C6XFD4_LIBAP|nr:ATP synthase F1 subunit epsilon [Candidatus Liberibacter asiaticus]ACT57087.1 F0F1 ATP synthase subunit epsilon [Candidatus Liberibacter asiaticus str. psy62]AGH16948.1 F0F1 ATP synthase subunit epsilon [Candidatus Liberibacter asiaticus str. gxpsy]ALK07287.1 ATP synthase F1 subunit epsilon [Candidatus Liberibacter asiaticus]ASK52776.1 ATP synthase F1 subunit epsilon [Candidatus Liberibacter asiaticus]AWL14095.1 ATP synthase F1 subunit epsilon [Candidatus Liberibacter asiaticus]
MSLVNDLHFELVSPEKCVFSGEVQSVVLPSELGDITVLVGHAPVLTTIKSGIVTISLSCEEIHRYVVIGGICDIVPSHCTVLSETILPMDNACLQALEKRIDEVCSDLNNICDVDQRFQMEQLLVDLSCLRRRIQ